MKVVTMRATRQGSELDGTGVGEAWLTRMQAKIDDAERRAREAEGQLHVLGVDYAKQAVELDAAQEKEKELVSRVSQHKPTAATAVLLWLARWYGLALITVSDGFVRQHSFLTWQPEACCRRLVAYHYKFL